MRIGVAAVAAMSIAGLSLAITAGGQRLSLRDASSAASGPSLGEPPDEPATASVPEAGPPRPSIRRKMPGEASGPPRPPGELERIAPREALGDLGLALPPKPRIPGDWKAAILYRPVAPAAGLIEAMGHSLAIAGVEPVDPYETCDFDGKSWPCGARARTAFRAWLRGRAVTCAVPPEPDRAVISASCQLGERDVGAWLVENGWARAAADGLYANAGEKARSANKGIFGPPPSADLPALPLEPASASPAPENQMATTPPIAPTGPFQ